MSTSKTLATKRDLKEAPMPLAVASVIEHLRETVDQAKLPNHVRLKIAAAVRRAIVPRRKPGRKDARLDEAYANYTLGMRGLELFRKHISRHDKLSQWRRVYEQRKLMKTLEKRAERDRKRLKTATIRG